MRLMARPFTGACATRSTDGDITRSQNVDAPAALTLRVAIRHLHDVVSAFQGHAQDVVARDVHRCRHGHRRQSLVAGGGQQQVATDRTPVLEQHILSCERERPKLVAAFQDASGLELVTEDLREISMNSSTSRGCMIL